MTPGVVYYSILLKDTKEMIGYVGVTSERNEIEIYIFKEFRRRSYGNTVLKAFSDMYLNGAITGKEEMEVVAIALFDNDPAIKLLEKAGFTKRLMGFQIAFDKEDMHSGLLGLFCEYVYKR